ncbi:MAG: hypothetical protein ABW061_27065 [Polyangiaceae bacterium]
MPSCAGNVNSSGNSDSSSNSNSKRLFLAGALALDATECLSKSDPSTPLLANGTWDLAFGSSYRAVVLVSTSFTESGSAAAPATQTEQVALRRADVTLTTPAGDVLSEYSSVGTGFIDAGKVGSPAYGSLAFTVIPGDLGATPPIQGAQQLVAKIRVFGEALDGTALTSNEFDFPIRVCTGCLVHYPVTAADPTVGGGYKCVTAPPLEEQAEPAPCTLGQDTPFSCVLCAASVAMCRDPSLNPSVKF